MDNIIIKDVNRLNDIKDKMRASGKSKLHVIADFDRTLTKGNINGQQVQSAIAQIRNSNFLPEEYSRKAHELFDTYNVYEVDMNLSNEFKQQKMHEWWSKHFDLLIEYKISKQILDKVVSTRTLELREGTLEFIDILNQNEIPIVIMSAGLGDMIEGYLKQEGRYYKNYVHVVSNFFEFDINGLVIKPKEPLIHSLNKDEIVLNSFSFYKELSNRTNVLLLGDGLDDIKMIDGFSYVNIIKVGFLNDHVEERLEAFKNNYDVVILNDASMEFVNNLLNELF